MVNYRQLPAILLSQQDLGKNKHAAVEKESTSVKTRSFYRVLFESIPLSTNENVSNHPFVNAFRRRYVTATKTPSFLQLVYVCMYVWVGPATMRFTRT